MGKYENKKGKVGIRRLTGLAAAACLVFALAITAYENLLYSCPFCNCSKNDDWVGSDANESVKDDRGYVSPCDSEYQKHLDRNSQTGEIAPQTDLGKYNLFEIIIHGKPVATKHRQQIAGIFLSSDRDRWLHKTGRKALFTSA